MLTLRDDVEGDVAQGDQEKLGEIVRSEMPGLVALARRLAGADADDLLQEALVRACRAYPSLRDPEAAPAWLRVIVQNAWRDLLRRRYRRPEEVAFDDPPDTTQGVIAESPGARYSARLYLDALGTVSEADVSAALWRLSARYRRPLVLRYVAGYTTTEIAELLDLPVGTVLSQLHRGRARFAEELRRQAHDAGQGQDAGERASRAQHRPASVMSS